MAVSAKYALAELRKSEAALKAILDEREKLVRETAAAMKPLQNAAANEFIKGIDIEEINRTKQGIRVQLLRDCGINSIADVLAYSKPRLVAIKGIGEAGAETILSEANRIKEAAAENVTVRIDPAKKSKEAQAIILALCKFKALSVCATEAENLYNSTNGTVEEYASDLKTGLSKLFLSKESKEKSLSAESSIISFYESTFISVVKEVVKSKPELFRINANSAWNDFTSSPAEYYSLLDSLFGVDVTTGDETDLDDELQKTIEEVEVDTSLLNCTLRKYQRFGVQYILNQKQVLLGDEMGLGKTIEAIAVMASLAANGEGHFVVVCPAAVLTNWQREIEQHSQLKSYKLHSDSLETEKQSWLENGGVAVTTFEMSGRIELPEKFTFGLLVVDEAHYIKNPQAQRTKSVLELRKKADRVLFMTGTPLENKLDEMCFLIGCLQPDVAKQINGNLSVAGSDGFRKKVAPVYIRRTREAVLKELPDLIDSEEWCTMTHAEKAVYKESVNEGNFMAMRQVSWNAPDLADSSKAERLDNILENAREQGRKVIVFSFFINTINRLFSQYPDDAFGPITGAMTPENRQKTVDQFSEKEGFAILFSQIYAGGTGLNIQAASVIVLCEPQLKPSIENQAISRAYRMGQLNSVLVYRLLCEKSIDSRVLQLVREKQKLFDEYADESVSGEETLKQAELAEMIEQEKQSLEAEA